jgi:replicative DNA helicase
MSKLQPNILEIGKLPPHDYDTEKAVLGALLIGTSSDVINQVARIITYDSFYRPEHGIVFKAIMRLHERFSPIDLLTVMHEITNTGKDKDVDAVFLSELTDRVATSQNIIVHSMIIQEHYITRQIISLCHKMLKMSYDRSVSVNVLINEFEKEIKALEEKAKQSIPDSNANLVTSVINNLMKIKEHGNSDIFITGNKEIDKVLKIMPNEIIFLAGAPKSAKTKTLIYIMDSLLLRYKDKLNVKWNSMEDPKEKVVRNRISIHTGIPDEILQGLSGHLTTEHLNLINEVSHKVDNEGYLEYNDIPKTIEELCSDFRSFVKKDKMNIMIIDNFNICTDNCHQVNTTDKEIHVASKITSLNMHLKNNGYKACIIVVDHLKKEQLDKSNLESGRRPNTSHLKGSERKYATLTQLLLINRPGKYRDVLDQEINSPDIYINGKPWKRIDLLAAKDSSGLIIIEKTEARNQSDVGDDVIARLYINISKMWFRNLYDI